MVRVSGIGPVLCLTATLLSVSVVATIDGRDPTPANVGTRFTYGWNPENRPTANNPDDDFMLVRMKDYNGVFTDTVSLFGHSDYGEAEDNTDPNFKFAFKRYALQSAPGYMVTVRVQNNNKCPVYMATLGFANATHRSIRGTTANAGNFYSAEQEVDTYMQPYYGMHLGSVCAAGTEGICGMGVRAGGSRVQAPGGQVTANIFDTTVESQESVPPEAFTFFEGKYVDGVYSVRANPNTGVLDQTRPSHATGISETTTANQMNSIQYSRFPIGWGTEGDPSSCTEVPILNQNYLAVDVVHPTRVASEAKIQDSIFPGAYDATDTFAGCTEQQAANVTVTIRWVNMNLFKNFEGETTGVAYPNLETPRRFATGITVGTNNHVHCNFFSGTITITRAAAEDEKYITHYTVYSVGETGQSGNVQYRKCTGEPFLTFTVDCTGLGEFANGRQCTKETASNRYVEDNELALATCDKFWVVSGNEVGEDDVYEFMSYGDKDDDSFPQADIPVVPGCPMKKAGDPEYGDEKQFRESENRKEHARKIHLQRQKAKRQKDVLHDDEGYEGQTPTFAQDKFVYPDEQEFIQPDTVGDWYYRRVEGVLDDVYVHDVYWNTDPTQDTANLGPVEADDDLRPGGFNVPYHRWTFEPSEMSAWSVTVKNYKSFDGSTNLEYDASAKVGIKGFAVMPLDCNDCCIATAANGSSYLTPAQIQARCEGSDDDDETWYDLTATNTNEWVEPCNSMANKKYQILVVIEQGFKGRYELLFRYKDYTTQHTLTTTSARFVGCIKKGQNRDFDMTYEINDAIIDMQLELNGTHVDGMYISSDQYSSAADFVPAPAQPSAHLAADYYTNLWAARLGASKSCIPTNVLDPLSTAKTKVDDKRGTWTMRVFREAISTIQDDDVEFVIDVTLRRNYFPYPTEIVNVDLFPSACQGSGGPEYVPGAKCFQGGSFDGFVSDAQQVIYQFEVPDAQQLVVTVKETMNGDNGGAVKRLSSVALQRNFCPDTEVDSQCVDADPDPCYLENDPAMSGVYTLALAQDDIDVVTVDWFLMVTARRASTSDIYNQDEAPFTVDYEYVPKAPPSPSPEPSPPPCSRFLYFCGEEWITPDSATVPSVAPVFLLAALAAANAWFQ